MLSLIFALALAVQDPAPPPPPTEAAPAADRSFNDPPPAPADRLPTGAPTDDYQFVGWCYGALRGYLELHDTVMPEVTRIESSFRRPGTKLEDDLKVYADMQKDGRDKLKTFRTALTAAERASPRPINVQGAAAVQQGQKIWVASAALSKARVAQEWMSWVLPARCERVAASLEARSKLAGAALRANAPDEPSAADAPAPAQEGPSAEVAPAHP